MIAYDHHITFIPKIINDKELQGSFSGSITFKEGLYKNWKKKLTHKWTFYNNQGRDIDLYTDRELSDTVKNQLWAFDVKEVVTFFWKSGSSTIYYMPQKYFNHDLLEYWSLHTLLPIFFTVEEVYDFLHAGAVEVEGKPVLFIAESFGGKSTMTDFFLHKGHALISDDKVGIVKKNETYYAVPSHPHHRPYRKSEDLGYFVQNMVFAPQPIYAMYKLHRIDPGGEITINEIKGIEKFKNLRLSSQINIEFLKAKRFEHLTDLGRYVPMFEVNVPWDIERLDEVYDSIQKHIKYLNQ